MSGPAEHPQISDPAQLPSLIEQMRAAIAREAGSAAPAPDPLGALNQLYAELAKLLQTRGTYLQATGAHASTLDPDSAGRTRQFDLLRGAVDAILAGDHTAAARRAIGAYAIDPLDWHSETVLARATAALSGRQLVSAGAEQRERFQPPASASVDSARAFICLADGDEIAARGELLGAWVRTFVPGDDVTLALLVDPAEQAASAERLMQALERAGIGADTELDLAVVAQTDTGDAELAREAHAVLSEDSTRFDRALAALPRFGPTEEALARLRAAADERWRRAPVGRALSFAIKIPPRDWIDAETWGDTFFALQFARELVRRGHRARLQIVPEWDEQDATVDVVVHLRGPFPHPPRPGSFNVLWNISRPSRVTGAECDAYDLIAAPSARRAEELGALSSTPVILLPQATDPANCFPEFDAAFVHDLTFVANTRGVHRQIMRDLIPTQHDLAVWGGGWHGLIPERHIIADSLPNDQIRRAYSSARIVLNDHMDDQLRHGIVNNRIYDVLACGGCVLSDHLPELQEQFGDAVASYRTPEELHATIARLLADPEERAERARRGRAVVLAGHTFGHRAESLLAELGPRLGAGV